MPTGNYCDPLGLERTLVSRESKIRERHFVVSRHDQQQGRWRYAGNPIARLVQARGPRRAQSDLVLPEPVGEGLQIEVGRLG